MKSQNVLRLFYCFAMVAFFAACQNQENRLPNIVIIFADDQGYGDLSCFGSTSIATPNIDALAKAGMKFTDFHVAASVCTPSRAALLTGCYAQRISLPNVLFPDGAWGSNPNVGINPAEETLAELLKAQAYATAMAGKWHLGHKEKFLPVQHGFDQYYGVPYSNDMPIASTMPLSKEILLRKGMTVDMIRAYDTLQIENKRHNTPLLLNNEVIEFPADQTTLTKRYTEFCVEFIEQQANHSPFFVYLAHTMPHIPIFASEAFNGKSKGGLYGDVIEEIDWSVGEIVRALEANGILDNTLVIFTSDNGPWLSYGNHGGTAGPLRGGKFDVFEGGFRVPCVMSWPKTIPKGSQSDQMVSSIDILPTICGLTGADLPSQKIDGLNILPVLKGKSMPELEERHYYYYAGNNLRAVRQGGWKYVTAHEAAKVTVVGKDGKNGKREPFEQEEALYNLQEDISEQINRINEQVDLAADLRKALENFDQRLKQETRPIGRVEQEGEDLQ